MGYLSQLRARRLFIPVVAVATSVVTAGIVLAAELPGSSQGASPASKGTGAATVQRQDLVATDTESGTLGYSNPSTVYNRLSGTITWLPTVGQEVKPGGTLFKVDNSPVILFDGTTPAYRTLSSGVSDGPDVQELNQNLVNLGFDPSHEITVNQTWQSGTTDAVNRWQAALGQDQTGTVTLGQVVFLPGPQLITTVQTLLGSTGASGSSGSGGSSAGSGSSSSGSGSGSSSGSGSTGSGSTSGASLEGAPPRPQFVDLTTTTSTQTTTTPDSSTATMQPSGSQGGGSGGGSGGSSGGSSGGGQSNAQLLALIALLKAEVAELKASRSSAAGSGSSRSGGGSTSGLSSAASSRGGGSAGAGGGGSVGGGGSAGGCSTGAGATAQPVLQTTSKQQVVTVQLDATKQTEAVEGEPVTVQLPDSSTVNGKITQVSPVAQSSSSSSSSSSSGAAGGGGGSAQPSATIPVTITLTGQHPVKGLDQAAVSVNFAQQTARNVLSVPVTALIATQGGGYAVQSASPPHQLIPVTPGLFAAGYVQISGPGIYPGLQVTDSQG